MDPTTSEQTGQSVPVPAPAQQVPVGVATKTGYSVTVAALVAAILSYVTGDHSQAELGSIVGAAVGLISLAITQIGRYVQANSQIKATIDLRRVEAAAAQIVAEVKRVDPQAPAQVEAIVRDVLAQEIGRLPVEDQTIVRDVENILLPSAEEEAAAQPAASRSVTSGVRS
jgi:hypothetical protein